ncbi:MULTISPECIES: TonB-dependent receptor [unclassified Dyella]|uniref:TonB-dependent receptor domain-containing protein n=1 Tax=unclassified Dyella TaxID=2634549 RepID=UPI000C81D685|nr:MULTISPECIES: TonB-dependent receptor [unclassified Dyella]MDR3444515.1 TonB-dependent receptor [Dyella sp.]PMQ05915.1 Colicin I receptor [Dyella sp. AD56]
MKFGENKLCTSVRLALSLGMLAASAYGTTAFAQDAQSQSNTPAPADQSKSKTLETVTVTGSLIRRVDVETASPVVTIDRAAIQATGKLTLGDLVQQLPAMTGGAVNPQTNNGGGTGGSSINLRGLGSRRTLILIDGQRLLSKDPNAIPADAIERIEVLPTGASATYGSDAIGGVVNFITRKNYQGATFTANVGSSDRNDGDQAGYTFTFGQTSDKGSIMAGLSYNKQDGVEAANRAFSKNALTLSGTQVYVGGSSRTPVGHIQVPQSVLGQAGISCASGYVSLSAGGNPTVLSPANYHCYGNSDKYNYAAVNLIMTPQERTGGFLNGEYHLGDHVNAYVDAVYEKTSSNFQLAPAVYGAGVTGATVDPKNGFNVFGGGAGYGTANGYQFGQRLTSAGVREAFNGRTDAQINTGFKGDFTVWDKNWNWDVGYNYGHESVVTTTAGLIDQSQLYTGASTLGANGVASGPNCPSVAACQFNPFEPNSSAASIAAVKAASVTAPSNSYIIERTWHAGISGELFSLPAGAVQLALGVEDRKDYQHTVPAPQLTIDPTTGSCALGSQCLSAVQGGYTTKDIYTEAFIPVLAGLPGVQSLNLTIGDRYSKIGSFGSTNNFKFALEYKPIDDLLLRGTMEDVFRAPNLTELYVSGTDAPLIHSDPCNGYTGAPAGSPLALACKNVLTDGSFQNSLTAAGASQASTVIQGSRVAGFDVKPEHGKSYDFGLVYSPSYVPGLSTTIDFWRVNLNNTITQVGLQSLLNLCAAGSTIYCQFIQRQGGTNPATAGQLLGSTVEPVGNIGSLNTSGIDWSANYKLPQFSFGQINIGVNATYLKYYDQSTASAAEGGVTYKDAGHLLAYGSSAAAACPDNVGVCLFPRWRAQGFVDWQGGGWSAQWRMRYIGRFQNGAPTGSPLDSAPNGTSGSILKYGATVYNDVSIGYNLAMINTRLDFGVNNLFDKQPPMLYANNTLNANTDPADFDLMGRYYWARVTVKF